MKVIKESDRSDFETRFQKLEEKIPRNYVSIIEFHFPGRYSKHIIRNFRNKKVVNFDLLADFEKIMNIS